MTEKKQDKLPVSQLIGFALNGCGSSCIAGILGGFLTVYLTDNLLLSMGFITAMMTAARIINAVTEGLSGFLIDMTHTKMGKARPWILGTAFFVALPVFLIFNTPTSFSPTGRMIWVFVNYLLHVAVFGAVISVATATLLIKITSNSVERAKVTNLGGLLGQISNLIVSAYGVPVLMYFGGYEKGYFGLSLIFCSIGFILPFLTGVICRETPEVWAEAAQQLSAARKRPSLPVKTQLKYVFGCKYALPLFGMFLTYNFAGMIFGSMAIYFLRDVLGDAGYMTQISYAKLVPGILCCLFGIVPIANAKLGKRKVLVLGSMFQVVGYALMIVPNLVFVLIGNAVYGIGSAFFGVLLGTATADVADYINLKKQNRPLRPFHQHRPIRHAVWDAPGQRGRGGCAGHWRLQRRSGQRRPGPVLLHPGDGDCGLRRNPPGVQYFAGAVQQPDGCRQRGGQHEKGRGAITWQTYSTVSTYRRTWAFPLSTSRTSCRSATRPTTSCARSTSSATGKPWWRPPAIPSGPAISGWCTR